MQKEIFLKQLENELISNNFIKNKINSHILDSIDVIGFDIDHTLSIYNTKNMSYLLYNSFSKYLINYKNYPKFIEYSNHEDFINKISSCEILLDFNNGNALKISNNKKIKKCFHGKNQLNSNEILNYYSEGFYNEYTKNINYKENIYYITKGNFEYHLVPLFLICVEALDKNLLRENKNYLKIKEDLWESLTFNFKLKDRFEDYSKIGYYFTEIAKNPEKYIFNYKAFDLLKLLKKKGFKIFFCTNSFFSYGEFIIKSSIGDEYKNIFDLGFWYSKKPFFFENENSPCFFNDGKEINININNEEYEKIKKEKFLFEGNFKIVENYFKKDLNKNKINIIYIGDDLINDFYKPLKINWKAIYINNCIKTGFFEEFPENFGKFWELNEEEKKDFIDIKCETIQEGEIALSNVDCLKYLI